MSQAAAFLTVLLLAGCGGGAKRSVTTTTIGTPSQPAGLRVGVVGHLQVRAAGAVVEHVSRRRSADETLVLVSASTRVSSDLFAQAAAHPGTHYVLVGGSAAAQRLPNLAGIVLRDGQAARLGGVVAGLAALEGSERAARVAWVGPRAVPLVN